MTPGHAAPDNTSCLPEKKHACTGVFRAALICQKLTIEDRSNIYSTMPLGRLQDNRSQNMENCRRIAVRDCQAFLWQMYEHYKGEAHVSFEGKISTLGLDEVPGATTCEIPGIKPIDGAPFDFWIVPINPATIKILKRKLSSPNILGSKGSVNHTQLAVGGQLVFQACDNFHGDCSVITRMFPVDLLETMLCNGILRRIQRFPD